MGIAKMLKVLVLGRPGSGKTTAVNHIIQHTKGLVARRFKDYEILHEMFEEDIKREYQDENERKFRRADTKYGGFDVLDKKMFDVALEKLEENVTTSFLSNNNAIVTIEFARDDYQEALSKFSVDFLKGAYLLFVECDLGTCIDRIYSRMSNPPKPDFHFVSKYIMRTYYDKENWDYVHHGLTDDFPVFKYVEAINNTNITMIEFEKKVLTFADLLVTEISRSETSELQPV